jgi:hypothetical protein
MDVDSLESAINSAKGAVGSSESGVGSEEAAAPQMSQDEEVGFHKGALNTLAAERNELVKMIGNVEAIMGAHAKRLEELGVKLK